MIHYTVTNHSTEFDVRKFDVLPQLSVYDYLY